MSNISQFKHHYHYEEYSSYPHSSRIPPAPRSSATSVGVVPRYSSPIANPPTNKILNSKSHPAAPSTGHYFYPSPTPPPPTHPPAPPPHAVLPPVLVPRYSEYPNSKPAYQQITEPSMPYNVSFPHGFPTPTQAPGSSTATQSSSSSCDPQSPFRIPGM